MAIKKLSHREELFVHHYLRNGGVAAAAARAAGYTDQVAESWAGKWVSDPVFKPHIYEAVHTGRQLQVDKVVKKMDLTVTPERILEEYARIAFVDPGVLYDEHGNPKQIHELDEDTRRALALYLPPEPGDLRTAPRGAIAKLYDKIRALDSLAKTQAMFIARAELSGSVTLAGILQDIAAMSGGSDPLVIEAPHE